MNKVPFTNFHMHAANPVEKIFWGRVPVTAAMSQVYFTKDSMIQWMLHAFKYHGKQEVGTFFGKKIGESLLESNRFADISCILPVPLHKKKEKVRGYNQAAIIAQAIGSVINIPVYEHALQRCRVTETQTHKNRIERWNNISGLYKVAEPDKIHNQHILLVDDVITTGATLEACANELMQLQNTRVSFASIAYASRE
ncbi:MAG TPA: hypothetical protein VM012_14155 [Flavitalea sp.]|nr:hypothetical protein [Flavitalea sp.]